MPGNIARYTLLNRISGEEDFLWQNDYGQKMLITGIELPPSYEVHFANSSRGDSVPELGDSSGVLIPDTVLTSGKPVYFWLFLHVGENDGQTVYGGVINVKPRTALPTVEPPTPAQQSILDELMAAMNNAINHVDDVAEGIPTAIDTALEQAKQSGEFKGDTGAVFTPSVTGAGVISWTNDGGLPNPETVDLGQGFATKDEINGKLDKIEKGTAGGIAELDEAGKVLSSQLPSFVDDVVEYPSLAQFPSTGESGKIYVSTSNNTAYRWSGTQYVPIGGSLTLGETSTTAYRGDRGSAAFSHALAKGSAYAKGLYKIRTNAEGHVIEATAVTKQDIVDLGIPGTSVDPSTLIDDTAPAVNKVYSSNKVEAELAPVKSALTSVQNDVESVYITAETTGTAEAGAYTWVPCVMKKGIKYKIKIKASKAYSSNIDFSTAGSNQVYVDNPAGTLLANKTEVEITYTPTVKDIAYIRFKVTRSDSCVYTIKTYHLESSELSADIDALNDDALLPGSASQITSSNYTDFFTDSNHAPMGKTFSINSNVTSAMIANLPSYGNTSILCTIPSMKGYDHGRVQIFSDSTGSIWFRFESGYDSNYNYTPWVSPTATSKMTCKIFKKVVCCGDSYTSGHINTTGTAVETNEDYAWPHYMETATGNEWVNCGVSGANVLTWQSAQRGLLKAQSCGKAQAYVVGLGLNDSDTSGQAHVDVGTSADIGTEAQTYYGGMSKIVRELNAINPTAKIFLNTVPSNSAQYASYNQAVRDIVNAYKNSYPVYLIDLEAVRFLYLSRTLLQDRVNGHYTAIGYEQFAEIYSFVLSEYINSHFWSFQNVYTIPYESVND